MRTGTVNLPLHGGRAPKWLFKRMTRLSGAISKAIIEEYGTTELLKRLSDPYWFQAFGCVLGFDWHSSGLSTTTMGALKLALNPEEHGVQVCGGKGKTSRKTPGEIRDSPVEADKTRLEKASRMTAKVDNNCIQDDFILYHHCLVFDENSWTVVQQGMNDEWARRYHWFRQGFLEEHPVACDKQVPTLDLTAEESESVRKTSLDLVNDNPVHLTGQSTLADFGSGSPPPEYSLPSSHPVRITPSIMKALRKAYEIQPSNYEELVAVKGLGAKSLRALALTAELVYGDKASWKDPAKYSFSHGGKDGTPFPVQITAYKQTIHFLEDAVDQARLGKEEKKKVLKRLAGLTLVN